MATVKGRRRVQKKQIDQEEEAYFDNPLEYFKTSEQWNVFYEECVESFEWCASWPQFQRTLTENLRWKLADLDESVEKRGSAKDPADLRILVPGCGISDLSEHLYDAGFKHVKNLDFSELAIRKMKEKNVGERPEMSWHVMDMTSMEFPANSFDVVVDKGGLDSLMEAELGPRSGNLYLSKVKRVVKKGGKYIIITNSAPQTIDILLNKFRFGWDWRIHPMPRHSIPQMQSFMIVMEKGLPSSINLACLDAYSVKFLGYKARKFKEKLGKEAKIRDRYLFDNDAVYTFEDLRLGAKGDISVLEPGRRIEVILGEQGVSCLSYYGVLLDAKSDSEEIKHQYAIVIVPQVQRRDAIYTKEGQWTLSRTAMASRLLLVILDSSNSYFSKDDVQTDLMPLAKQLSPAQHDSPTNTPFFWAHSGIKQRQKLCKVISSVTGPIVVEDVIYRTHTDDPRKDRTYRRLIFSRTESLVQSEVPLSEKGSVERERETKHEASSIGETEKEARHKALVETEKEAKHEAQVETEKEAEKEESVQTNRDTKNKKLPKAKKGAQRGASVKTKKHTSVATVKEASQALLSKKESNETKKETKIRASSGGETEKEAKQDALFETEKEAKQEASAKIEKDANQEAPVKIEEEAKQEALVETKKEASQEAPVEVEIEKEARQEESIKTEVATNQGPLVETEKEAEQEAFVEPEKEAEQEAFVEPEKQAKQNASVETEMEKKQEASIETAKEVKHEASVATDKEDSVEIVKEEPVEALKEAKHESTSSGETEKEGNQESLVESEKESCQETEVQTDEEAKQDELVETENVAKQKVLVATEREAKQEASAEIENEANEEESVKTEKEAKQDTSVEIEIVVRPAPVETEKEANQEVSVESEIEAKQEASVVADIDTKPESSVETEIEDKQDALVETEKEANQDISGKTQIDEKREVLVEIETETKQEASSSDAMGVDHNFLTSSYHIDVLMGIIFFSSRLLLTTPHGVVKAVILGLGTGLLPMYLKKNLTPALRILVFELDRVVVDVARKCFGFKDENSLEVLVSDGIGAVKSLASMKRAAKGCKYDILIVDVASTDTSSGLSCPGEGYVENSFLLNAKELLSEDGMLIMNLVSRSSPLKVQVYSRLKEVFGNIFRVEIEKDVSEVIFALKTKIKVSVEELMHNSEAFQLATSLGFGNTFTDFRDLLKKLH